MTWNVFNCNCPRDPVSLFEMVFYDSTRKKRILKTSSFIILLCPHYARSRHGSFFVARSKSVTSLLFLIQKALLVISPVVLTVTQVPNYKTGWCGVIPVVLSLIHILVRIQENRQMQKLFTNVWYGDMYINILVYVIHIDMYPIFIFKYHEA